MKIRLIPGYIDGLYHHEHPVVLSKITNVDEKFAY